MGATPIRDTTTGEPKHTIVAVLRARGGGQFTRILLDAENDRVVMEVIDSAGNRVTSAGSVDLKLSEANGKELAIREWDVCIDNGGEIVRRQAMFVSSLPY